MTGLSLWEPAREACQGGSWGNKHHVPCPFALGRLEGHGLCGSRRPSGPVQGVAGPGGGVQDTSTGEVEALKKNLVPQG